MAASAAHSGRMKLSEYICRRLYAAGCHDVFGVPGDFNLGLFDSIVDSDIRYVGCCNELNAAYAADAYARVRGLGCCCTTYAVGELSALNGVAGSFSECVPVVKICGGPARKFFKDMPLLHHTLGDYMTPFKMYEPITVDQSILNNPRTAARDFERCLRSCLLYKRPVYILVPSDMARTDIDLTEGFPALEDLVDAPNNSEEPTTAAPPASSSCPISPKSTDIFFRSSKLWSVDYIEEPDSNEAALGEAIDEIIQRVQKSKRPVFIPGIELIRRGLQNDFYKLTTKSNIPYATMLLSKGLISECHPNFMGLYMGARSSPEIRSAIADSDCVVIIGEKLTDFNTGGFTSDFKAETRIMINFDEVQISNHLYRKVYIYDVIRKLVETIPIFPSPAYEYPKAMYACPNRKNSILETSQDKKLTMKFIFKKLAKTLPQDCILLAETGASMFSAAETMLPHGGTFISQVFYGSIGYTVGACLGACIAVQDEVRQRSNIKGNAYSRALRDQRCINGTCSPRTPPHHSPTGTLMPRRVILSIGDGSFQVTAPDLATMIRNQCNPIIVLLNNDGYTIERVITDNVYNDILQWRYHELPRVFGGDANGVRTETEGEFELAIIQALEKEDELSFIEAVIDRFDCNKLLKGAGRQMALTNCLTPSMTEEMINASS